MDLIASLLLTTLILIITTAITLFLCRTSILSFLESRNSRILERAAMDGMQRHIIDLEESEIEGRLYSSSG